LLSTNKINSSLFYLESIIKSTEIVGTEIVGFSATRKRHPDLGWLRMALEGDDVYFRVSSSNFSREEKSLSPGIKGRLFRRNLMKESRESE